MITLGCWEKYFSGCYDFSTGHGKGSLEIHEPVVNLMAHDVMTGFH